MEIKEINNLGGEEIGIIEAFRVKTEQCFHKIGDYTLMDIEEIVLKEVNSKLREYDLEDEVSIIGLAVAGSRSRGFEREDSDLDVVLEFQSDTWREDELFNLLHEDAFSIEGVTIDINPIKEGKSGTLEDYLFCVEKYLAEKEKLENENLLKKVEKINLVNGCFPMVFGNAIVLPAEYDDELSDHEKRRLVEVLEKGLKSKKTKDDLKLEKEGDKVSSSLTDKISAVEGRRTGGLRKGVDKDFCL